MAPSSARVPHQLDLFLDGFQRLLSWLIKGVVVNYGGRELYRTVRPFFLGMILGHFTVYDVFRAIDFFTGMVATPSAASEEKPILGCLFLRRRNR